MWTEPVSSWTSLLGKMYADPARWTMTFQMRVLSDYMAFYARHRDAPGVVFVERSLVSSMVFVATAIDGGTMDSDELAVYMRHHTANAWEPDRTVFIDAAPDECFRRMRARDRPSERSVGREYIEKLDMLYRQSQAAADIKITPGDAQTMAADVVRALNLAPVAPGRRHSSDF